MSRVLVERETIYNEEVEMLMKGATYTEVINYMDSQDGKRKENPFERFETPSAPSDPDPAPDPVNPDNSDDPNAI
jgi:hypothetical protein